MATGILGRQTITVPPVDSNSIITFYGESNSGGYAVNADCSAGELLPRTNLKILNNTTLLFETMQIGVNNLIGHAGLPANATHGWENGLANLSDTEVDLHSPVYLVKNGQGGSTAIDWVTPGYTVYNNRWVRVDIAVDILTALKGEAPAHFMFYSLGINDALASTNTATFKTQVKLFFSDYRTRYGFTPIFLTQLPVVYAAYNTVLSEICTELSDTYFIQTSDAGLRDSNHWNYSGMKLIAGRMVAELLTNYIF